MIMQLDNQKQKKTRKKRINMVSLKVVREKSIEYGLEDTTIRSPRDVYELCKKIIGYTDREYALVICLSTKNKVNAIEIQACQIVSIGSLNAAILTPREVFKTAVLKNSCSIIVAHSHPGLSTEPSHEDLEISKRLHQAGELLGISLIDSLIIAGDDHYSLKEHGHL
jgi:DNA repair protein RadC